MKLSRKEILTQFDQWLVAWDEYDLENVMAFMHPNVMFENWDGAIVNGKADLQKAWTPWFIFNGNFKFIKEDISVDEEEQKITFQWRLEWPSFEKTFKNKPEQRRGVDVLYLTEGKIIKKFSYSKTVIQIDANTIILSAQNNLLP